MDIKSNVSYDSDLSMYKIDFGFYTNYFDYIIYGTDYYFIDLGEKLDSFIIDEKFEINNYLIGCTVLKDFTVVCLIDIDDFKIDYIFCKKSYIFSHIIRDKKFFFLSYVDLNGKAGVFHNCYFDDYEVKFDMHSFQGIKAKFEFEIFNNVIGLQVFSKIIYLTIDYYTEAGNYEDNLLTLDIADLYFFDDYFVKENGLSEIFTYLNDKTFQLEDANAKLKVSNLEGLYLPKYKLSFFINPENIDDINISELLKYFASLLPHQYFSYTIDNKNITNQFDKYFMRVKDISVEEFDLSFKFPYTAYNFDEDFMNFQENFMELRYLYFNLKYSLNLINNNEKSKLDNTYVDMSKIKVSMNKESLEIMIKKYEEIFEKIVEKIKVM